MTFLWLFFETTCDFHNILFTSNNFCTVKKIPSYLIKDLSHQIKPTMMPNIFQNDVIFVRLDELDEVHRITHP